MWTCHSTCGRGGSVYHFEMELSGKDFKAALAEVQYIIGRRLGATPQLERIIATYDYVDEAGNLLYQVVRYEPKSFRQRRPDGQGAWIWKKCQRQVLYRLREVMDAPIVFVVEGEKDVETLRSHGFVATTNAGGAKAPWLPAYTEMLRGREVILIPDDDAVGKKRVLNIARALVGQAAKVIILELEEAKDITIWFESGHSELKLIMQVEVSS